MSALTKFKQSPWAWVSTLYFIEGIPYFLVNEISVILFKKMGVPNGQMALFTSLIYTCHGSSSHSGVHLSTSSRTNAGGLSLMQVLMAATLILLTL